MLGLVMIAMLIIVIVLCVYLSKKGYEKQEEENEKRKSQSDDMKKEAENNKKFKILLSVIVAGFLCVILAFNLHFCEECGKPYFGDGYSLMGFEMCKNCYQESLQGLPSALF